MSINLYPPIAIIRSGFFEEVVIDEGNEGLALPGTYEPPPEMPAFLADMIRRRVEAQFAFPLEAPAVGQIRSLDCVPSADGRGRTLSRTYGILLGSNQGSQRWSGWIVAQEADYATDRDLVLQEDDGPFSPEAAMVQAWNPVTVWLRGNEPIVGKLAPERLAAVSLLAERTTGPDDFVAPRPGRIGAWDLTEGFTVVTGTPIGDESDPRQEYQKLYGGLAEEITRAAQKDRRQASATSKPSAPRRLRQIFVRPAWTFGAMGLALAQAVWIILSATLPTTISTTYRTSAYAGKNDVCTARIRVTLNPDSSYADLVVLLRRIDATLVDGPSETGEIWIALPHGQTSEEPIGILKLSPLVESADEIPADKERCAK